MSSGATSGLTVAAGQFPVSGDVAANGRWVRDQLEQAAAAGAGLLLTSEAALSGYAGVDHQGWADFDWSALRDQTRACAARAGELGLWLILGSAHCLDEDRALEEGLRPTNCLYVFAPGATSAGASTEALRPATLVDRYDKCMLTDTDQLHYTAGRHRVVVEVGGLNLGLQVCYDICYPELYATYRSDGAQLMLHAFHNAGFPTDGSPDAPFTILDEVKPAWLRARAADNQMWIVAANSSRPHSCWGNKVVRPDGSVADELPAGEPGIVMHRFPDDTLKGWLHNFRPMRLADDLELWRGPTTEHPRYLDRQSAP